MTRTPRGSFDSLVFHMRDVLHDTDLQISHNPDVRRLAHKAYDLTISASNGQQCQDVARYPHKPAWYFLLSLPECGWASLRLGGAHLRRRGLLTRTPAVQAGAESIRLGCGLRQGLSPSTARWDQAAVQCVSLHHALHFVVSYDSRNQHTLAALCFGL